MRVCHLYAIAVLVSGSGCSKPIREQVAQNVRDSVSVHLSKDNLEKIDSLQILMLDSLSEKQLLALHTRRWAYDTAHYSEMLNNTRQSIKDAQGNRKYFVQFKLDTKSTDEFIEKEKEFLYHWQQRQVVVMKKLDSLSALKSKSSENFAAYFVRVRFILSSLKKSNDTQQMDLIVHKNRRIEQYFVLYETE